MCSMKPTGSDLAANPQLSTTNVQVVQRETGQYHYLISFSQRHQMYLSHKGQDSKETALINGLAAAAKIISFKENTGCSLDTALNRFEEVEK